MKDHLIKTIQKFLNGYFTSSELLAFLDKQKDFLLKESILNKTEKNEYNALWDTIEFLENKLNYTENDNLTMACKISVLLVFNTCYTERKNYTQQNEKHTKASNRQSLFYKRVRQWFSQKIYTRKRKI